MAERVQLSRAKGWRKPDNTVVVARPTMWGNWHNWKDCPSDAGPPSWARGAAVDMFREDLYRTQRIRDNASLPLSEKLTMHPKALRILAFAHQLRGKNLACWCPLDQPCHADVLLGLANADLPNVPASDQRQGDSTT